MFDEFMSKAASLRSNDEPFVVAIVVRSEAPISGKPGDKAIIYPDGRIWGWIGGGCAQPLVIKEALKALNSDAPRLLRISPASNGDSQLGVVDYSMTCHSGGSIDIYIEPVLPKPHVLIIGRSLVAQTLAHLASAIDFKVSVMASAATREFFPTAQAIFDRLDLSQMRPSRAPYIVVATQGESDEEALELALEHPSRYLAFVVSRTKRDKIFEYFRGKGVASQDLNRVSAPAGLSIGAVSPAEIAVSILAEIVQVRRSTPEPTIQAASVASEVHDPICGMVVDPANAKHKVECEGQTYFFCCAGCKQTFERTHL